MKKNQIIINSGTDYKKVTKDLLVHCRLDELIGGKEKKIGIKPNLVAPVPAFWGSTTHPEVVSGLIEYLQECGFQHLIMMEGSWVGDKTEESFEICGYREISEKYNVPFLDLQKEKGTAVSVEGEELHICTPALKVDFFINVPVLKGHCQTKITCALKNMKGLLPNSEKRRFHSLGLHKPIALLNRAVHQDFILVDNICGDLDSEDGGNPFVMNRVLAGRDPVLMDAYVCQLLHYKIEEVPYIKMAENAGVGCADLELCDFQILGEQKLITIPENRKLVDVYDRVEEVDSCSACYAYLVPAILKLKEEGLIEKLTDKICIGQGYRGKKGTLGIGNCTRQFSHFLPGCPPLEEEIYMFLKDYIKE